MANTNITLLNDGGIYLPSTASVAAVQGDSVSFSTNDKSPVVLFFSPHAASVLEPNPGNAFPVAAGEKATFTFTSSKPGAYSVFFGTNSASAPKSFSGGVAAVLSLEIGSVDPDSPPFTANVTTIKTGS